MRRPRLGPTLNLALAAVALAACWGRSDATPFDVAQYVGTSSSTWTNEETGATGPVEIVISADESAGTADRTIDFGGNYLGLGDPPPAELTGTFDSERAVVEGHTTLFGDYDVTIEADGSIVALMEGLGGGVIPGSGTPAPRPRSGSTWTTLSHFPTARRRRRSSGCRSGSSREQTCGFGHRGSMPDPRLKSWTLVVLNARGFRVSEARVSEACVSRNEDRVGA